MQPNEPDEDATSDLGESLAPSEFTALTTTRLRHSFEQGRRYQTFLQGRYGLPNDDIEQMREGMKHKLYSDYILDDKPHLAPIGSHPQKIVDLGTGVGLWAHDMGELYPSARVIGIDISPIQPAWSPPNVEFRVEDLDDDRRPWTRTYEHTDLFHIRGFLQTVRKPERVVSRSFENLNPGGWIECHEIICEAASDDGTVGADHPLNVMYDLLRGPFTERFEWQVDVSQRIPEMLQDAGFININVRRNKIPLGRWHHELRMREMGMFNKTITEDWATAMLGRPDILGLSEEKAVDLMQEFLEAVSDLEIHAYSVWIDVWAQKPAS